MSKGRVVFLMYHELESPGRPVCQDEPGYVRYVVRQADFRAQMEWLKREGWRGVSLGEAMGSFAEKTIVITFDDGSETDLLYAAPALRELNFGATFYVTTGFLEKTGYLSHAQLRELSRLGFEIGCHSMTHAYLTDLSDKDLHREVAEAKVRLEELIGQPVQHFSCPGGRYNRRVAEAARDAGYRTLATSRIRINSAATDPLALGRVAILRTLSLTSFEEICRGGNLWRMNLEVELRTATKRLLGNSAYDRWRSALLRDRR